MKVISFNEIIELNHVLEENKLAFRIHLRDACGRQSMWIEPLGNCACDNRYEELYQVLNQYFLDNRYQVEYSEDKLNLWILG